MDSRNLRYLFFKKHTLCKYPAVPFTCELTASHTAQVGVTFLDILILLKPDRHFFPATMFAILFFQSLPQMQVSI